VGHETPQGFGHETLKEDKKQKTTKKQKEKSIWMEFVLDAL
jgi:hypothetical protein